MDDKQITEVETPADEVVAKIEQWIRERHPDATILRATTPLDKRRLDVFLCTIEGVGKVWIEAGRDSRIGQGFITWERQI